MSTKSRIIRGIASATAIFLAYYFRLPPINIFSTSFWVFFAFAAAVALIPQGITKGSFVSKTSQGQITGLKAVFNELKILPIALIVLPLVILLIGKVFSSQFFHAKSYASIININEAKFEEDMKECESVTNIALMDSKSAAIIGNRTLGSLSQVVSQYEISGAYTQINFNRTPQKVANLEYADFFKWFNNKNKGIPGYVMVDPVNNSAKYIESQKPIVYSESGCFSDDLMRKLRFSYPTKIFDKPKFEVDDNGNPKYIVPCLKPKVFLFGAMDVCGAVIFDPCTGDSDYYSAKDIPAWVDAVYDGHLAIQKFNWNGMLSGGYWNSVFGNVDCKVATDDFGYIVIEDDVWYFTGVTSITSDESNIGFILSNARTAEYKYYPVIGAEEYSAMHAAEGEVQEKGYVASFPSLINISGEATYIMVLKDSGGLVKLYALVNVENYHIVATGEKQSDALNAYKKLLKDNNLISQETKPNESKTAKINVKDVRIVLIDGVSVAYITADTREVYKKSIAEDESIMLISQGDVISIEYTETDNEKIREIVKWTLE